MTAPSETMKVSVKILQGQEMQLDVTHDMCIMDLKEKIGKTLKVPVPHQKLLVTGQPLLDCRKISDYPQIKDGTKLMLVVKRPRDALSSQSGKGDKLLRDAVKKFSQTYFGETMCQKVADEFVKEFNESVTHLSLDDVEQIATSYSMEEAATPVCPVSV